VHRPRTVAMHGAGVGHQLRTLTPPRLNLPSRPRQTEDVRRGEHQDSLDVVELVMELEDEFDITIPDDDYDKIRTVGDAIAYIEEKSS